jgi:PAS domain S-box-containing protein
MLLLASVLVLVIVLVYAIGLLLHLRDWRLVLFVVMPAATLLQQALQLSSEWQHIHRDTPFVHLGHAPDLTASLLMLLAIVVVGRMLTERQDALTAVNRSEQMFRKIFRGTPDSVLITRLSDGRIMEANEAFERISGFRREDAIGKTSVELGIWVDPGDRDRMIEGLRRNGRVERLEVELYNRRGERLVGLLSAEMLDLEGEPHFVSVVRDVTEQRRLQQDIIDASDNEQRRLGHDLHDSLAQDLVALTFEIKVLRKRLSGISGDGESLDNIERRLREAIENTRRMAQGLSPVDLEQGGLETALRRLAESQSKLFGVDCHCHCEAELPVSAGMPAMHLYRIVQEASSNAIRHGKCRNVWIDVIPSNNHITLSVTDDGQGVIEDTGADGMGLRIMRYRANALGGRLSVSRRAEGGTCISCVCPVPQLQARTSAPEATIASAS